MLSQSKILELLDSIKLEISVFIASLQQDSHDLFVMHKSDNSIVTVVDTFISDLFKEKFLPELPSINFYSEEDLGEFVYPMIILDPIDGTKELAAGLDECAISFGLYYSSSLADERNFSWIYNPFTGFEVNSIFRKLKSTKAINERFIAYVSRSEFAEGLHVSNEKINYYPKGSIAYKLGLLAAGAGDFVITKKNKNIWDIMAGTHICYTRGMFLRYNKGKVDSLNEKIISSDLIWCADDIYSKIAGSFQN
jgi:myo-inositol-1(or 4)-monophosphatase